MANKYDEFGPAVEDYSSFGEAVTDNSVEILPVKNANLLEEFGKANESVAGGLRSFITGRDARGGFNNPTSIEKFTESYPQSVMNLLEKSKFLRDNPNVEAPLFHLLGTPMKIAGMAADAMTNPLEAAGSIVTGGALKGLASKEIDVTNKVMSKFNGFKKPSIEDISAMKQTAIDTASGLDAVIKRTSSADLASIGAKYTGLKKQIGDKIKTLSDVDIKKAADEAVLANRGDRFFNWARDISKRFGTAYEKAIAGEKISTAELHSSLGNVLKERGLLDGSGQILKPQSAWSQSEGKIYDYYNKVGSKVPGTTTTPEVTFGAFGPESRVVKTGQDRLDLSQVDKDLKSIFASKDGTPYQSGDHILTQVRRAVTDNFPGSGKIKAVRGLFKNELQAKNEAIKVLDPFNKSGSFDTTGGSNFFSRYANGKANPDEVRWIEAMRKVNAKEGNIFQGLDDLASQKRNLIKEASNLPKLQEAEVKGTILGHQESLAKNQMDTENHINLLDAMMKGAEKDKAMADFGKLLLKAGAVGAVGAGTAKIVGAGAKSVTGILE